MEEVGGLVRFDGDGEGDADGELATVDFGLDLVSLRLSLVS